MSTTSPIFPLCYGGDIGQAMLMGTWLGAMSGAVYGGMEQHFGGSFGFDRVLANSVTGGVFTTLGGGDFEDGFWMSLAQSSLMYVHYNRNNIFKNDHPSNEKFATEDNGWIPNEKDALHQFGEKTVKYNKGKYGHDEAVFYADGPNKGLPVKSANGASYNIGGKGDGYISGIAHTALDIAPAFAVGNTPNDPTTPLTMYKTSGKWIFEAVGISK